MAASDDVCVLIPTYDEAATIGEIVVAFRDRGYDDVLVIDGGSTDGTREIAADAGARVEVQTGSGKGQAIREAVRRHVDRSYVLMLDGDATYRPDQAERLLEPLLSGEADHVIGDRFADMRPGAMTRLNRAGNRIINRAFSIIHGRDLGDILSGYRAFTRDSFRLFALTEDGFGIETELAVECVKHGVSTAVVPITYEARPDASETNLRPVRDGANILATLYTMAKTNNPLFYFGSVGTASTLVGLLLAAYVGYEWFIRGISHEVIAIVAASGILFGVQLLIFGVLSDMIVTLNREQTRQFQEIARTLHETDPETAHVGDVHVDDAPADDAHVGDAYPGDDHAGEPSEEIGSGVSGEVGEESDDRDADGERSVAPEPGDSTSGET